MMKTLSATLLCLLFALFTATLSGQEVDSTAIKAAKRDLAQIDSLSFTAKIDSLFDVAQKLRDARNYKNFGELSDNIAQMVSQRLGKNHVLYARSLHGKGVAAYYASKFPEAERHWGEAKKILVNLKATTDPLYIKVNISLGELYSMSGRFGFAEALQKEVLDFQLKTVGAKHPDYAKTLSDLGILYSRQGKFPQAEPLFLECKTILEEATGKNNLEYAGALGNLAILYRNTGDYNRAEQHLMEAMAVDIAVCGKECPDYALTVGNLGDLYFEMGRYEASEQYFKIAMELDPKIFGENSYNTIATKLNLANLYRDLGYYDQSEQLFLDGQKRFAATFGERNPQYAGILMNMALLYSKIGFKQKAKTLFEDCLERHQQMRGKSDPDYAKIAHNLADLYSELDLNSEAEALYKEALAIWGENMGKNSNVYAGTLNNMGNFYHGVKRYDEALAFFLEAKDICAKNLGTTLPIYVHLSTNLARLYRDLGQFDKAETTFREIEQLWVEQLGNDHMEYARVLNDMSSLYWRTGQLDIVAQNFMAINDIVVKNIRLKMQFLSANELETFIQYIQEERERFLSLTMIHPSEKLNAIAYNNELFYKGVVLENTMAVEKLSAMLPDSLYEVFIQWKGLQRRLATEYTKPKTERKETVILEEQANSLEKTLTRSITGFAQARQEVSWQEVRNRLQPGEAAIEFTYFHYSDFRSADSTFYAALLVRQSDTIPQYVLLCERKKLDSLLQTTDPNATVARLYTTRNIEPSQTVNLSRLYPLIWKPLDSLLQGVNTIYYAPAGLLHRVAFNAIPTDQPGQVLADKFRLFQLGSTRSLVVNATKPSPMLPSSAVLAGGIRYEWRKGVMLKEGENQVDLSLSTTAIAEARRSAPQTRGAGFQYLPGTKKEVTQLEKLFTANNIPSTTFTDTAATEEQIKLLGTPGHPAPAVLHLATHGFFFPDPATKPQTTDGENHFSLLEHPLLRSGLALAGANQAWKNGQPLPGREDGILTAYEISNLNLTGTQLAVLSACETGLGDIQGSEGVYGLQRAFKIAGVERLIVTLWDVPDKETAAFMSLFYEKWLNGGKDIRAAFYETQTAMRQRYKDPFVWAAFVLIE